MMSHFPGAALRQSQCFSPFSGHGYKFFGAGRGTDERREASIDGDELRMIQWIEAPRLISFLLMGRQPRPAVADPQQMLLCQPLHDSMRPVPDVQWLFPQHARRPVHVPVDAGSRSMIPNRQTGWNR